LIVLESLKGRPNGELCAEHEISQAQYYQWREMFLRQRRESIRVGRRPQRQGRLQRENARPQEPGRRVRPGAQKKRGDPGVRLGPYTKVAARISLPAPLSAAPYPTR
jgi:hypothetical protein